MSDWGHSVLHQYICQESKGFMCLEDVCGVISVFQPLGPGVQRSASPDYEGAFCFFQVMWSNRYAHNNSRSITNNSSLLVEVEVDGATPRGQLLSSDAYAPWGTHGPSNNASLHYRGHGTTCAAMHKAVSLNWRDERSVGGVRHPPRNPKSCSENVHRRLRPLCTQLEETLSSLSRPSL
jgi:hypothetical protein